MCIGTCRRNQPSGLVHFMDALVSDVAIAKIPEPVPVVVNQVGVKSLLRCRPQPDVERQLAGGSPVGLTPMLGARLVAEGSRDLKLAELSRLDHGNRMSPIPRGTALRTVLDDPVVTPRGFDGHPTFVHVVAARFFDVDVLARLAGPDRDQRVPVIRRGNRDSVDRLIIEHPANVLNGRRLASVRSF